MSEKETPLIHPYWEAEDQHKQYWKDYGVTAIICERDTDDILKLCVESLLRFYPDLPVLIIKVVYVL